MPRQLRVAIETLGCKLNQAESEHLARELTAAGFRLVPAEDLADIYILNTCTVTGMADAKSRCSLRAAHRSNPKALVVATGCYAQRSAEELLRIEGIGLVMGNDDKPNIVASLKEVGYPGSAVLKSGGALRTRSFIKAQDGCSRFCAYCIVPYVRGHEKSVPADEVVAKIKERVAEGCQEVVLTGTEVGAYGYGGLGLRGLLERILAETAVPRLRLSSLQPQEISPGLLALWQSPRLMPHFHLSLQSGSDAVLSRMGRRYNTARYEEAVKQIRATVPDVAITTDVIAGFPGETEEEFRESLNFCQKMGFARIHVFAYSPRPGTRTAAMPGQIDARTKKGRARRMLALAKESARRYHACLLGRTLEVLWEQKSTTGVWSGYTGNYIRVYTRAEEDDLTNKTTPVKLAKLYRDGVWCEVGLRSR